MSFEPDCPVIVFYLATEPFRGGFRWLVKQYGAIPAAAETGNEAFATEAEARKSGRRALIQASARVPVGGRRAPQGFEFELVGRPPA